MKLKETKKGNVILFSFSDIQIFEKSNPDPKEKCNTKVMIFDGLGSGGRCDAVDL